MLSANLALGLALLAAAPASDVDCGAFDSAIDRELKVMADIFARSLADDSAPRATMNEMKIANGLSRIALNLELMKSAACPLPTEPITGMEYVGAALQCQRARLRRPAGSTANPLECDSDQWSRWASGTSVEPLDLAATEPPASVGSDGSVLLGSDGRKIFTFEGFKKVAVGMTLEQVKEILGDYTSIRGPFGNLLTYAWENASGSYIRVDFKDGVVYLKQQSGLD